MNPAELAARANRRRTFAEVERDLQAACRAVGAIAGAANITGHPIDRVALQNHLRGLEHLLIEGRDASCTGP